jgi:hypothetical protein
MTSKIKVDNINKVSDDSNIINKCGTTITLGASGDSIALASGASQTGFGRTGTVDWQTGSIKTSTFTATNGEGYFVDTSSGAVTANLPAGSAGAIVAFADYTRTFQTNALTINPNGSEKIGGVAQDANLGVEGQAATFVYVDATEGWINVQNAEDTEVGQSPFIVACGGTPSTCGDFKIHTFTGPGTFTVTEKGSPAGSTTLEYIVVAGGGGTSGNTGNTRGGGGGGGFRFASPSLAPATYPGKPLAAPAGLTAAVQAYPVVVGAGGPNSPSPGSDSTFSTITSAGGGGSGGNGGSGGGGAGGSLNNPGGTGNTPPVAPPQGNNGGTSATGNPDHASGGGGGAIVVGANGRAPHPDYSGNGGDGAGIPTAFGSNGVPSGSFRYYAGGGGGGGNSPTSLGVGDGGKGGGGSGGINAGIAGTVNSGGGAGGGGGGGPGAAGGSGIVVIRYKFQ